MGFFRQTWMLTATGLRSLPDRFGAALVTLIGVTTVVGVLVSLLALEGSVASMIGTARPDMATVLSRGAANPPSSVISRETLAAVMDAPGIKRAPDGAPYAAGSTLVGVDAIRNDGTRGTVYFVGVTPGTLLVDEDIKIIEGRRYRPAVRELIVSDSIRKLFRGFGIGDRIT
ncbi:MAG TPA: hypothetical protein VFX76_17965, partial [Roseiflexaceae bacterium]|nr:hypothetical protein [Roseiflexaceae bacterium]